MELPGVILSDPYFTEEQWKLVVNEKHSLLDEVMKKRSLLEEVKRFLGDHDEEKKEKKEELGSRLEELISHLDCSRKQHTMPLCLCIAHEVLMATHSNSACSCVNTSCGFKSISLVNIPTSFRKASCTSLELAGLVGSVFNGSFLNSTAGLGGGGMTILLRFLANS